MEFGYVVILRIYKHAEWDAYFICDTKICKCTTDIHYKIRRQKLVVSVTLWRKLNTVFALNDIWNTTLSKRYTLTFTSPYITFELPSPESLYAARTFWSMTSFAVPFIYWMQGSRDNGWHCAFRLLEQKRALSLTWKHNKTD